MSARASVIVRARDEARFIERLLEDVRAQTYDPLEIVVVDSGSTDGTLEIAERLADRVVRIAPEEFTFGRSLNKGSEAARGEFLVFVSAHTYPVSNNWLANLIAPFDDPSVGMVYGRQLPAPTTRLDEERDLLTNFGEGSAVSIDNPLGPNNANAAVRAELWREVPFDEELTGLEDLAWAQQIQARGHRVFYADNAGIVHIHEESLRQVFRRFRREGQALGQIMRYRMTPAGGLKRWASSTARDVEFGLRRGERRRLLSAPASRAAEFAGLYAGLRDDRRLGRERIRRVTAEQREQRAVVISAPGEHDLKQIEHPRPAPGEVTLRVAYVGVCHTDLDILDGTLAYYREGRARYPVVPGHEFSGVVEAVGDGVRDVAVGDRAVGECILGCGHCPACAAGRPTECAQRVETGVLNKDGAYATRVTLPARAVHRVPDALSLRGAALCEPTAVVHKAARALAVERGRRACIVGAGPIGQLAAQVLRARGADVALIDRDPDRLTHAAELDMSTATTLEGPELHTADVVVEATGNEAVLEPLLAGVRPDAHVCLLGLVHDAPANGTRATVFGSLGSDPEDWPAALDLLAGGRVDLSALTRRAQPLEDYADAWQRAREGRDIKQLLVVDGGLQDL
jgi:2-desacetyl-2-hydroxyethyl bacteriochlorophyllide A dehydrogenase